jgi:hypothetical protein
VALEPPLKNQNEMTHTQREFWNGAPERLRDAFTMTKSKHGRLLTAVCEVWSHEFGWELKLMIEGYGLQMSSVVRSAPEMMTTIDESQAAMSEKGWQ